MLAPTLFSPLSSPSSPKSSKADPDIAAIVDDDPLMSDLSLLFESLLSNLRATECLRTRITRRATFDKRLAFAYCDFDGDGRLGREDLKRVLCENGAAQQAREGEVVLIIEKFKRGRGGDAEGISLEEYVEEITPKIEPEEEASSPAEMM